MDDRADIIERLDKARRLLGKNHEDLGEILGLTKSAVGSAFSRKSMKISKINLIAKELDINLNWLTTGEGRMFNHSLSDGDLTYNTSNCNNCEGLENTIQNLKKIITANEDLVHAKNEIIEGLKRELTKR